MQRSLRLAILIPCLVLLPMAVAQTAKEAPKIDEAALAAKAAASGTIQGKLKSYDIDGDVKKFTIVYVHQTKGKINPAVQKQVNDLAAKLRVAIAQKNAKEAEKIRAEGNEVYSRLYDVTETPVTVEFVADKNLAFRTMEVPTDDEGKPKKDAKQDPKTGGYPFDAKLIDVDMIVKVTIDKAKFVPEDPTKAKPKPEVKPEIKKEVKEPEKKEPEKKVETTAPSTGGIKIAKVDPKKDAEKKEAEKKEADAKAAAEKAAAEKAAAEKAAAEKAAAEANKVVYPINVITVIPPMNGPGAGGGNPFTNK